MTRLAQCPAALTPRWIYCALSVARFSRRTCTIWTKLGSIGAGRSAKGSLLPLYQALRRTRPVYQWLCVATARALTSFPCGTIGKSMMPHALRGVNIEALGLRWRASAKAWMTADIMADWLGAFYKHVGELEVILLMDNFRAHVAAIELAPPPSNVRIEFLPKNSTSQYQPLDQGVIKNFKHYYRKLWLRFSINCYERKQDPV
jgi:hypothetical protein